MYKIIRRDSWSLREVENNPNVLYLYFDGDHRINDENPLIAGYPNTVGIPVRKSRSFKSEYVDSELADNVEKINKAFTNVMVAARKYDYVVIPYCEHICTPNFIKKSSKTYAFLKDRILTLIQYIIDDEFETY